MGTEENYLDNLLKSITVSDPEAVEDTVKDEEGTIISEPVSSEMPTELEIADISEELEIADIAEKLEIPEAAEELEIADIAEELEMPEAAEELEIADIAEELEMPEAAEELKIADIPEELEIADISEVLDIPEMSDELEAADSVLPESDVLEMADIPDEPESVDVIEESDILEISEVPEELKIADIAEELEMPELLKVPDELELSEVTNVLDELESGDVMEQSVIEESEPESEATEQVYAEVDTDTELDIGDISSLEMPVIPDVELTEETDNALDIGDLDMPELESSDGIEVQLADELNIDGLEMEETSPSETELEMSDELNLEELDLDTTDLDTPNADDDLGILDGVDIDEEMKETSAPGVDDGLDDVLSMLDDDADLAEINDILKKSDSNEPIQDEMMDLLNQMADDEAALVNAGVKSIEEDGGVPIPNMLPGTKNTDDDSEEQASSKKKKKNESGEKKPGAIGKLFNLLTEELPGPTEADYAAEDAKKAAKKQEALTKKEEEKLAKEEAKQAKAEEKEAAKKAKAEAAAQKKKEKDEAKAKKAAEKQAKQAAEAGKRAKRIPPKKIAAVAAFGASVFGGVMIATNVLSNQGYINVAKKAFYDGNYKEVYLATYGMDLRDSDALIKGKSEVILKMQRWYDSYQNNLKLGREREALDALLRSIESYDYINAEAEEYGVLNEVEGIKGTILGVLQSEYGLSEEQARVLLDYEDALEYTVALNNIITGK